jgi:hypothetical protein
MEVRDVLLTGRTGRLSRRVVDRPSRRGPRAAGDEPERPARHHQSRLLLSGEGIEAAVRGAGREALVERFVFFRP